MKITGFRIEIQNFRIYFIIIFFKRKTKNFKYYGCKHKRLRLYVDGLAIFLFAFCNSNILLAV